MKQGAGRPSVPVLFETAGEHLSRNVPVVSPHSSAGEIRSMLAGKSFECAAAIAVCEAGVLVGLLTIEALLSAAPDLPASRIMDREPPVIDPGTDQEVAAWKAVQHGESVLAVVDEDRRFIGLIPPERLLSVLLQEHQEDIARLSGMLKDSLSARTALEEPVTRRFLHRLPWLAVGLIAAVAAADLVGSFEEQLREHILLAFFLPGIVYLADAVGTQTETLIVRGLSAGIPIRRVIRSEIATGALIAAGLAAASVPIALWRWGHPRVVLVIAFSLLLACCSATLVAMALPWAFDRFGKDPAFGSGPLATVVQDLLSIAIYLAAARWLL